MESKTLFTLFDRTQVDTIPAGRDYLVIAKQIESTDEYRGVVTTKTRFFLKTVANRLINPSDYTVYELRKNDTQFVEVAQDVYETYIKVINHRSPVSFRSLEMRMI